jgi:hypothetical protein
MRRIGILLESIAILYRDERVPCMTKAMPRRAELARLLFTSTEKATKTERKAAEQARLYEV